MKASVLERAIAFALQKHQGQTDKAGKPYILHPLRLVVTMTTDDERVAAVLHDVVEDTDATFDDLVTLGVSDETLSALRLLTHDDGDGTEENYFAYIGRIKGNSIARSVKLADLADNLNVNRLPKITERDAARLSKYLRAKEILLQGE